MKFACLPLAIAACIAFMAPATAAGDHLIGRPSPSFVSTDLHDRKVLSVQYTGRPMLLNFFATWCAPCKRELPTLVKGYARFHSRVVFIGFDQQETPQLLQPFLRQYGVRYRVTIDQGQAAAAYNVATLPESVFIDRHGIVRALSRGYLTPQTFARDISLITR